MIFSTSTDVLAAVLRRLPTSDRRRARLVCRLWRDAVDERTTEMHSRAKALLWNTRTAVAYVVDDISCTSTGSCFREVLTGGTPWWDKAYSFAYHPTTGRYKVVHVPCVFKRAYDFAAVQVLTVGKHAAWREVRPSSGGARCNLKAGVVSVDGTTYWVTNGAAARVVALSLDDERIAGFALPSPALSAGPDSYHLAGVRGRLAVVVHEAFGGTTGVWVREEKTGTWTRRCGIWSQDLTRPHFVHGELVTTFHGPSLRGHRRKGTRQSSSPCDVTVGDKAQGTLLAKVKGGARHYRTFAYGFRFTTLILNWREQ
uniref:Putative F-box protein n=1 Tax=Hordeum vulgare subsp. vulgare TaxID=112509 RepID=A0A023IND3_HORVV|nr:putative F-box protein [Hordeum vulgare subsp. vulgare]